MCPELIHTITNRQKCKIMQRQKLILQLLQEGMSQSAICAEVQCSKSTVSRLKQKAGETGRSIGELLQLPDDEFETILGAREVICATDPRKEELLLMMPEILRRLGQRHAHMQYVYDDYYSKECPEGYKYTQFKKYVKEYRERHDYSYHNTYEPGKEWQIDFAGDALWLTDRKTGERQKLVVLVCVMPYSNLPFMMAMPKATTEWFYHGLNKGLEFMGALPAIAKSDNMKQWVTKSDRYSPSFSEANESWCAYYGIEPTACRVRKPRDKGPAEGAVNQLYKYVYPRIEGETWYSLDAINGRIFELLDEYCSLPYKGSTRWGIFEKYEKPQMKPLPHTMYRFRYRKEVKLTGTYHVCVGAERHMYSVPFKYVGQMVKVFWDVEHVEVYAGTERVARHERSMVPYGHSTKEEHMPEKHKAWEQAKEVNAATLTEWAARIGPSVKWAVDYILTHTTFPQQAYGRCSGVLALAKKYGRTRLEHVCTMMRESSGVASYGSIRNMLRNNRDIGESPAESYSRIPHNDNVRGASAYMSVTEKEEEGGNHE